MAAFPGPLQIFGDSYFIHFVFKKWFKQVKISCF